MDKYKQGEGMNRKKPAFTLMELLVIIAIMGLMLAIIAPTLQSARMQAADALCMANLCATTKAWRLYAGDNDGKLCNGHVPRDAAYADESHWLTTTMFGGPYKDNAWFVNPPHTEDGTYAGGSSNSFVCTLEDEARGIRSGTLYPYIGSLKPWHCPSDKSYLKEQGRGGMRSYSITGLMHGEMPNNPKCVDRLDEVISPAEKIVFVENEDNRGWNMGSWIMNYSLTSPSWIDPLAIFHNDKSSFGFADGHAEKHKWLDGDTIRNAGGDSSAPSLGRDVEWVAAHYVPGKR